MCDVASAMLGMGIASAISGVYAQRQQAKAQEAANKAQYDQAVIARNANINQTNLMAEQEREAAGQKINENNKKARQAMSTAWVTAGENGISGLSVDALLRSLAGERDDYNQSVRTNYDRSMIAINNQRENANINANSVIASLQPVQQPDYLGAALKIGSAVTSYGTAANWWGTTPTPSASMAPSIMQGPTKTGYIGNMRNNLFK